MLTSGFRYSLLFTSSFRCLPNFKGDTCQYNLGALQILLDGYSLLDTTYACFGCSTAVPWPFGMFWDVDVFRFYCQLYLLFPHLALLSISRRELRVVLFGLFNPAQFIACSVFLELVQIDSLPCIMRLSSACMVPDIQVTYIWQQDQECSTLIQGTMTFLNSCKSRNFLKIML